MTKRILIIGPSWVGDTVMAQCLFKLLYDSQPRVLIDVLAPSWTFPLLSRMKEVNEAIEMPIKHGELKLGERYQLAKRIQAKQYDHAYVLPNSLKSALIPWLARIPKRTGWRGEYRYGLLNDVRHLDKKRYPRMIDQYMALGLPPNAPIPDNHPLPSFEVSVSSQQTTIAKHGISVSGKPILALCAGAEFGPSKRWPENYYADVANQKIAEGWDVWLFGSPKDRPVNDKINEMTQDRCENLSGRLELFETIDLLSMASGVVTNDSGLLHVAAALQKPTIGIYGSTSPVFTPPLGKTATVLKLNLDCQPCFERTCPLGHHRCMKDLTPDQVLAVANGWGK